MKRVSLLIFALLLVSLSGCVLKDSSDGSRAIESKFKMWWTDAWALPVYGAFGIGIVICSVSWIYASLMQDDKIKVWVKSELVQLGYSAVIIVAIMALISSAGYICTQLPKLSGIATGENAVAWENYVYIRCELANVDTPKPCHVRMAEDYLQILAKSSQGQGASLIRYMSILYPISSVGLGFKAIPAPGGALSVAPLAGIGPAIETMNMMFNLLLKNLLTVRAQQFAVDVLHVAFFPYLLASGIFFRTLYFTRKLGGLLISLAVGFYIVLIFMYVFWMSILFSFTGPWIDDMGVSLDDPTSVGLQTFVGEYEISTNTGAVMPVKSADSYYEKIPIQYNARYPAYTYRGETCANGVIEPWEECGEDISAKDQRDPPQKGTPIVCKEQYGKGYYCDTNACKCTNEPRTDEFREDYSDSFQVDNDGNLVISQKARIAMNLMFSSKTTDEQNANFIEISQKSWHERLLEGYGGAIVRAVPSGYLLGENGIIDNVAKLLIFSLVAPFISLMVALGTVKTLSPTLGGDIEIAGLSRLL